MLLLQDRLIERPRRRDCGRRRTYGSAICKMLVQTGRDIGDFGQTLANLAEKVKGHSVRWDRAIKAYLSALKTLDREGDAWIHCTRDLAAAAIEAGSQGDKEPAIEAIDELLKTDEFTELSVHGSRILDLRATLLLMRANDQKREADFSEAIQVSRQVIGGVWSGLGTSEAIGGHHHLAQACRDLGNWLIDKGRKEEALKCLKEAEQLFVCVERSYRQGVPDAELNELVEAAKAANDEVVSANRRIEVLRKELAL